MNINNQPRPNEIPEALKKDYLIHEVGNDYSFTMIFGPRELAKTGKMSSYLLY
jgi:hypothetical protein